MARPAPSISPGRTQGPPPGPTPSSATAAAAVAAVRRKDRSLGFLPLLLMSLLYVVLTVFVDAIGPITSDPGFYQLGQDPPLRGCIIPRASP